MHLYVYCSIIYNIQIMDLAQVSIDRWIKRWLIYTQTTEQNSDIKKEWNFSISNMDGCKEYYAKQGKSVIEKKNTIWFQLYVASEKQINTQTKKAEIDP